MVQILKNGKEDTLVQCIKQYTTTGKHLTYSLLLELAEHIRAARTL